MNYLDAWKIVNEYIDFYANGVNERYHAYSSDLLSFAKGLGEEEWKKKLIDASCIFWAHAVLWISRTAEQYDNYLSLFLHAGMFFTSPERAKAINEAWDIQDKASKSRIYKYLNKTKIELATQVIRTSVPPVPKSLDEKGVVIATVNHMEQYLDELYKRNNGNKSDEAIWSLVNEYCCELYKIINLDMPADAPYYFLTFDNMRRNMDRPEMRHYYTKYADLLFSYEQ